ncbi:CreA family protein [Halomonas sp. KAO]|uniref:CreA family protein n=1 Tax=unclassified Halomonas TaxID=2609666 RepID=UPI0018A06FCA|nr:MULTISPECIES: CreA family protein [unclassified Halomonas]MBF7053061.1 CreA family protein [Halomonas sp. KAO]MDT0500639.1 CreA family protein [Halomonas sp. PAR7]MDT0513170.1 CreA family protein [Halomonas sp. LES1]MDT0591419.1 CreA family protein [Halomonas sp. PAR8]
MPRVRSRPTPLLTLAALSLLLAGCGNDNEVGDVSLGLFTTKDIKIESLTDPKVTGVTCHLSNIEADLDFADPSDSSLACRQTGPITPAMLADIDTSASGELLYRRSKSVLFKSLKVRRIFDADNQTLLYLVYSTKETSGSFKHALSSVPLWNTQAWQAPVGE